MDVLNDDRRKLQNRIDIVGHYPRRYRLVFSVDKTKVTVTGSKHDVNYYKDVPIWFLNKEQIKVTETNEHLWLIVSGENAKYINSSGSWNINCKTVQRSGVSALLIRPTVMEPITNFQRKTRWEFLKQSKYSPVAPLYFIVGELPLEANLHIDVLILFWNFWSNPFETTKYTLMMSRRCQGKQTWNFL